jgi:hypothetical protein
MSVEELLQMLQEKGMDDNAISELLDAALKTIHGDDVEHDEKADAEAAGELLGVEL